MSNSIFSTIVIDRDLLISVVSTLNVRDAYGHVDAILRLAPSYPVMFDGRLFSYELDRINDLLSMVSLATITPDSIRLSV